MKETTSHPRREIHAVGYIKQTSCALGKVMDDRRREFRFVAVAEGFSLLQNTPTGPGAHQASYPSGCRGVEVIFGDKPTGETNMAKPEGCI